MNRLEGILSGVRGIFEEGITGDNSVLYVQCNLAVVQPTLLTDSFFISIPYFFGFTDW